MKVRLDSFLKMSWRSHGWANPFQIFCYRTHARWATHRFRTAFLRFEAYSIDAWKLGPSKSLLKASSIVSYSLRKRPHTSGSLQLMRSFVQRYAAVAGRLHYIVDQASSLLRYPMCSTLCRCMYISTRAFFVSHVLLSCKTIWSTSHNNSSIKGYANVGCYYSITPKLKSLLCPISMLLLLCVVALSHQL